MDGKIHAAIGAGIGLAVAQSTGSEPIDTVVLITAGILASLAPDLDTGGKLANKLTVSHKLVQSLVRLLGMLTGIYAWFRLLAPEKFYGIALGVLLLFIAPKFSQKLMLLISGVSIAVLGGFLAKVWILLIGGYIVIAALLPHRSYTHSLLGVLFFHFIALYIHKEFAVTGLYWVVMLGYGSHLIADMRLLPGNKRGIKLFLPFSRMEV